MVFQMLALMNCPKAVLVPNRELSAPLRPVVSLADPAAKGFQPPRSLVNTDDGVARLCRVSGVVATSLDSVLCPVPADVAVAWVTAADWSLAAVGLVIGWAGL